jgi:hypothetical protein
VVLVRQQVQVLAAQTQQTGSPGLLVVVTVAEPEVLVTPVLVVLAAQVRYPRGQLVILLALLQVVLRVAHRTGILNLRRTFSRTPALVLVVAVVVLGTTTLLQVVTVLVGLAAYISKLAAP